MFKPILSAAACLLLLITSAAGWCVNKDPLTAEDANILARLPLAGLKSVAVSVYVEDQLKSLGFTEELASGACRIQLRTAGIAIADSLTDPDSALLSVEVKGVKVDDLPLYAVSASVSLYDAVSLPRTPEIKLPVIVWNESAAAYSGADKIKQLVLVINPLVKAFAKDFLAANPSTRNDSVRRSQNF